MAYRAPLLAASFLAILLELSVTYPARAAGRGAVSVGCVGLTVSDADRASDFFARVLEFRRELDVEVSSESWERLEGVFGLRSRTVRVRLGAECLDLTDDR